MQAQNYYNQYSYYPHSNIVRDYNKNQGVTHPADVIGTIPRDYHTRKISVENSSVNDVMFAIVSYVDGESPKNTILLKGGEVRYLSINPRGSNPQYLWILNAKNGLVMNYPALIISTANSLVLREGINKWNVQYFYYPSLTAAH
ncbi:MAG TPA: hypothetical protein VLE02_01715 [Nitrosarchaeum sp.]|nr:hypothetical protein [Nitrosarchaeum sp.]